MSTIRAGTAVLHYRIWLNLLVDLLVWTSPIWSTSTSSLTSRQSACIIRVISSPYHTARVIPPSAPTAAFACPRLRSINTRYAKKIITTTASDRHWVGTCTLPIPPYCPGDDLHEAVRKQVFYPDDHFNFAEPMPFSFACCIICTLRASVALLVFT